MSEGVGKAGGQDGRLAVDKPPNQGPRPLFQPSNKAAETLQFSGQWASGGL